MKRCDVCGEYKPILNGYRWKHGWRCAACDEAVARRVNFAEVVKKAKGSTKIAADLIASGIERGRPDSCLGCKYLGLHHGEPFCRRDHTKPGGARMIRCRNYTPMTDYE